MGHVVANLAMSLDGFIADELDRCDDLFGFYEKGERELVVSAGWPAFHMDEPSATLFLDAIARTGCHVMGRRLYDITNGWDGHTGGEVPMVVLTHEAPDDWPRGGVPIHFVSGAEDAMSKAQELAGGKDVSIAGATATREVLDAGLLDEIVVSLVPVILGEGIPWFAGSRGPVTLSDPEVIEDKGVTHLRYQVVK